VNEFSEGHRRYRDLDFPECLPIDVSKASTVCRLRSAAMMTLESRITPRRGDSMVRCAL
jgi:hypothetical protein